MRWHQPVACADTQALHLIEAATAGMTRIERRRGHGLVGVRPRGAWRFVSFVCMAALFLAGGGVIVLEARASVAPQTGCRSIHWVVNVDHAPPTALKDARDAFEQLSHATGLRFVYDGLSHEAPSDGRAEIDGRPILLAWTTRGGVHWETGQVAKGYGEWSVIAGGSTFVSGYVYLRTSAHLRAGFAPGATVGLALLHELGHAMGLGHSTYQSDVMYPSIVRARPALYSAGDQARLAAIGESCGGR